MFNYDFYALLDPNKVDPSLTWTQWSEYAPKFIQQVYPYWMKSRQEAFLKDAWLQKYALLTGWGVYQTSWLNNDTGFWFSTPEAWRLASPTVCRGLMYQRARAIWELLCAVKDPNM